MRSKVFRAAMLACVLLAVPQTASAFCGFYVSGAEADLYNNASVVVMMRDGTRTVLSMQNNYEGPPGNFAMVVPVPVVLSEDEVRTLPLEVFDRIDTLAAPRLVEYWERDPCEPELVYMVADSVRGGGGMRERGMVDDEGGMPTVVVEAEFEVGEYEVVILSAYDSMGLDTWLRENDYRIPEGAEEVLRPYVASGMKFFVARVNVERVTFENGQAMLSPLRFHYDSEQFALPIRLGLLNAHEEQDLLVHVLARNQRYEVANYANVTVPTNLELKDGAQSRFGEFYAALLDRTLAANPGAVLTEYAWMANNCDPCPGPVVSAQDLQTLGADVVGSSGAMDWVLTRLHARYTSESLGEDLVFSAAPPIVGGRQHMGQGAESSGVNNFQGRYIVRHHWEGPMACENPIRGRWGGPWEGGGSTVQAAEDTAFVPRGRIDLTEWIAEPVPELGLAPR